MSILWRVPALKAPHNWIMVLMFYHDTPNFSTWMIGRYRVQWVKGMFLCSVDWRFERKKPLQWKVKNGDFPTKTCGNAGGQYFWEDVHGKVPSACPYMSILWVVHQEASYSNNMAQLFLGIPWSRTLTTKQPPTATSRALRALATAHDGHLLAKLDGPQLQNPETWDPYDAWGPKVCCQNSVGLPLSAFKKPHGSTKIQLGSTW